MKATLRTLLAAAALAAAALCPGAAAQGGDWYAVELIVFAHPGGDARSEQAWRPDPGIPDVSRASPVSAGGALSAVSPSAYRLSGIWQALRASPGYRPLRHLAWIQSGASEQRAPEVLVGEEPGAPVHGVVQLSRGRFLHLKVDLLYSDGEGSYRFIARRRMRSNELHYLDHPLFGVLVMVSPLRG